jgi:hypothetical protein
LGGTATFAAIQAERLGLRAGIVTRVAPDLAIAAAFPNALVANGASLETTSFQNVYQGGKRRQSVLGHAEGISVDDVPLDWRSAPVTLLGPVCGEVPSALSEVFTGPLIGVSAQGWLRRVDRTGHVRRQAWNGAPFWRGCRVLFVSDEDVGARRDQIERWIEEVPVVALTSNRRGASVHDNDRWRTIAAFPSDEVDPTGAGDIFATAFLVRLRETDDVAESTRFASAAAACAIEAPGVNAIATRDQIEVRMRAHPEVVLQ